MLRVFRRTYPFLVFSLLILSFFILPTDASSQTAETDSIAVIDSFPLISTQTFADSTLSGIDKVIEVLNLAGWMRYPIYLVFALGMFFIVFQILLQTIERFKFKKMEKYLKDKKRLDDIEDVVKKYPDNELSRLYNVLLSSHVVTKSLDTYNENLNHFLQIMLDKFSSFKNWIVYLADSAGALGLLGTVLGMFNTFFGGGGTLQPEHVVSGMGLALITTLMGIVVSLILNFFFTITNNHFNKNKEMLMVRAEDLRFLILRSDTGEKSIVRRSSDIE